jgi:hypothetical protein
MEIVEVYNVGTRLAGQTLFEHARPTSMTIRGPCLMSWTLWQLNYPGHNTLAVGRIASCGKEVHIFSGV